MTVLNTLVIIQKTVAIFLPKQNMVKDVQEKTYLLKAKPTKIMLKFMP